MPVINITEKQKHILEHMKKKLETILETKVSYYDLFNFLVFDEQRAIDCKKIYDKYKDMT